MANRSTPSVTTVQALAVASQFGITLAISVVLGYFAGHWLDDRLNTGIIFTLIGVLLGLVASVLSTVRTYNALMRQLGAGATQGSQNPPTMESARKLQDEDPNG